MRYFITFLLIPFSQYTYSQNGNKPVSFTIGKYKESVGKDERDYWVTFKLKNLGKDSLMIWDHRPRVYIKYCSLNSVKKDILSNKRLLENIDVQPILITDNWQLGPNEVKDIETNLLAHINKRGLYEIKFFYRLADINENIRDAESEWISMYFLFDYDDIIYSGQ
jgi:hypothetical protein